MIKKRSRSTPPRLPSLAELPSRCSASSKLFFVRVHAAKRARLPASAPGPRRLFYTAPSTLDLQCSRNLGLFTASEIGKGERILQYKGIALTAAEVSTWYGVPADAPARAWSTTEAHYLLQVSTDRFLDSRFVNCAARYINHKPAEAANCTISPTGIISTTRRIPANSELFFSYGPAYAATLRNLQAAPASAASAAHAGKRK